MQSDWLTTMPIAHRGLHDAHAGRPENSMPAFEFAAKLGIPFELDVQQASDGTLVIVHDVDVDRVAGERIPVAQLDRGDLSRLRLGTSGERIPRLAEVLALVNGAVPIVLDLRRWGSGLDADLATTVLADLGDYPGPVALQSFDPRIVRRLRKELGRSPIPDRQVGQISGLLRSAGPVRRVVGRTMITNWLTHPDYFCYEVAALESGFAAYWAEYWHRRRSLPLIAFTVTSVEEEEQVSQFADNFFFDGYVPKVYLDRIA